MSNTPTTSLRIAELDFATIKENLKNYLRSQSEFQDFDFEGSGMSVLLDILAYNTHYMGYYLNMVGNEAFLDTAQLRQSVISLAKLINYVPGSKRGAGTKVNILVTPAPESEDTSSQSLTLDKYTRLLGADIDGINYPFITLNSNTVSKVNGSFYFSNVKIVQGEVVTRQFEMTQQNTNRRFLIPSANVDINNLTVTVQESRTNTYTIPYSSYNDITEITSNTAAYFVEEDGISNYVIYFGDGIIGKKPKNGSVINITYIDTVGGAANSINNFSFTDSVGGKYSSNVRVISTTPTFSGSEKETVEQIRFRAPYYYTTQNRAVTRNDYETLILKDYPNIESVTVWGGQDNNPPIYGKVFISLKTKANYFLTEQEKEEIKERLIVSRNILTVIPEIVNPDFTYLLIRGTVFYDPNLTSLTAEQIKQNVRAAISDYRDTDLLTFDSTFRKSKLQTTIENSERSIVGSNLKIFLQKRLLLDTSISKNYTINTNFPIKKGDFNNRISTFPEINVRDSNNVLRQVFFEEIPEAFTGVESIVIVNPGINYTSAPTVTITGDGSGATATAKFGGGRVQEITITNKGSNYTRATVSLTGGGGSQASAVARLETKLGSLRTYYFKTNGEKVIVNSNAGTINYETGEIILRSLATTGTVSNSFYDTNELVFNLPIDSEVITPLRNRILEIDENDPLSIQIDVDSEE
jgi:hypothetical protein